MLAGAYLGEVYLGDISDSSNVDASPTPGPVTAFAALPAMSFSQGVPAPRTTTGETYLGVGLSAQSITSTPGTGLSEGWDTSLSSQTAPGSGSGVFFGAGLQTAPSCTLSSSATWGSIACQLVGGATAIGLGGGSIEAGSSTDGSTRVTASTTFANNNLVLALFLKARTSATPTTSISFTGTSIKNPYLIGTQTFVVSTDNYKLELWAAQGTGFAGAMSFAQAEANTVGIWKIIEFTNVTTSAGLLGLGVEQVTFNTGTGTTVTGSLVQPPVTVTTSMPAVQIPAGPGTVAAVVAIPAPVVQVPVSPAPSTVTAVAALPAPTVTASANTTPVTVSTFGNLPAPTVSAPITPTQVVCVVAVPSPVVSISRSATPTNVISVTAVPSPTVTASANPTPTQVTAVVAIPVPSIQAGANVSVPVPAPVVSIAAVPAPTVTASGNPAPSTVVGTVAVPAPGISSAANVSQVVVTVAVPAPTVVTTLDANPAPATVTAVVVVPSPLVVAGEVVTRVTPNVIAVLVHFYLPPLPMARDLVHATFVGATPKATAQGATRVSESVS